MTTDQIIDEANKAWNENRFEEWHAWLALLHLKGFHKPVTRALMQATPPRPDLRNDDEKDIDEYIEDNSIGGRPIRYP